MQRRTWLLAALLLTLPACDSDSSTEADTSIVGTYSVQTVDGHTLPYTVDGEVRTAGTLQLKSDKAYSVVLTSHFVNGGDSSFSETGTYTYTNNDLALRSPDGSVSHGSFSGTTLTISGGDGVFVLKKN